MFKGLGNLGDLGKIMQQAKEMQSKAEEMQQQLEALEVTGSAGAGMVTAVATGKGTLNGLTIDPSLLNPEEKGVLEDLIVAAVRDAQEKASGRAQEEMSKLTDGLPIPPGLFGG